jgi:large subunit ribosomal protein L32
VQPSQKSSKARSHKRKAHKHLTAIQVASCPRCSEPKLPHSACAKCGYVRPGLSLKVAKAD